MSNLNALFENKQTLQNQINVLKNKLSDIENAPEITETQIGKNGVLAKKYFLANTPFFPICVSVISGAFSISLNLFFKTLI